MTLVEFLLAVNRAGVRLANVGGRLLLRGAAISREVRAGAAEHKAAILTLLPPEGAIEHAPVPDPPDPAYLDWRLEWLTELGALHLAMRACRDEEALSQLRRLAQAVPTCKADWLAIYRQIAAAEHELRSRGKLPAFPWPDRD